MAQGGLPAGIARKAYGTRLPEDPLPGLPGLPEIASVRSIRYAKVFRVFRKGGAFINPLKRVIYVGGGAGGSSSGRRVGTPLTIP